MGQAHSFHFPHAVVEQEESWIGAPELQQEGQEPRESVRSQPLALEPGSTMAANKNIPAEEIQTSMD